MSVQLKCALSSLQRIAFGVRFVTNQAVCPDKDQLVQLSAPKCEDL